MAGGDGSLSVVAAAAAAHGVPFICIPAGTRNHFARDLGLDPNDLVGALDAFTDALEGSIDLGDVNGRPFLNNVSLGVYGAAVQRESYRDAKARTLLEPPPRCWVRARSCPACALSTTSVLVHTNPAVVLCRTTPTHAAVGPGADLARRSTAAGSEYSFSTGQAVPPGLPAADGPAQSRGRDRRRWGSRGPGRRGDPAEPTIASACGRERCACASRPADEPRAPCSRKTCDDKSSG